MIKIMVPESGVVELGALRSIVQGKADDEVIAFQGGRYVDPPVIEGDDVAEEGANQDAAPDPVDPAVAPKAKRSRK